MTNSSLGHSTLEALFEAAASTDPTPGGGCVSAINGYLGISLLIKAVRISARKSQQSQATFAEIESQLLNLATELLKRAASDSEAFDSYIKALKMSKETDAQRELRSKALREAKAAATQVALDIMMLGNGVLGCASLVKEMISPTILADFTACVEFALAMNIVARENAKANLSGLSSVDPLYQRLEDAVAQQATLVKSLGRATSIDSGSL